MCQLIDWNSRIIRAQLERLERLCDSNRRAEAFEKQHKAVRNKMLLGLWPNALALIGAKPDLFYGMIRDSSDILIQHANGGWTRLVRC